MKPTVTLITGGVKSGKTAHSLERAGAYRKKAYIATAEPVDAEMCRKIAVHKTERDESWITVEEPLSLADAFSRIPDGVDVAVIDCLTTWVGNMMHHGADIESSLKNLLAVLKNPPCAVIIVTNEVGLGVIGADALTRRYVNELGGVNRSVAAACDTVILVVSGIPVTIKERTSGGEGQ